MTPSPTEEQTSGEFDRSRWYIEGASPEITAEETRRTELCEAYIRSAKWGTDVHDYVKTLVATNVRGAWPVAYTQGFKDGETARQPEIDRLRAALERIEKVGCSADDIHRDVAREALDG